MSWIYPFTEEVEGPFSIAEKLKSTHANLPSPPPPSRPITISIVGAGQRGSLYAQFANIEPKWAQVVAVAEPVEHRRNAMAELYNIPKENVFTKWEDMIECPKLSDAVIISTLDNLHVDPLVAFADKKYHILLEKPMAINIEGCVKITDAIVKNEVLFAVGHVLRYTPHNILVKEIIDAGYLGNIVNIQHAEHVGFWHFAHSYVRGNWRNEAGSSFSLMTKKVSSFGSLMHFNSENKPKEAENGLDKGVRSWPVNVVTDIVDIENLEKNLINGPYGKCVYESDNDVVDNQVVNLEFKNGSTANITMIAYTEAITERKKEILVPTNILGVEDLSGHAGGDMALMRAFIYSVNESFDTSKDTKNSNDNPYIKTGIQQALHSHLCVFAAEHSRKTGETVSIQDYKKMKGIED
ncbi:2803_t:CDS:10 [Cetraspora pellucida]|uniref:2803_t:CDS:1 n=1 Tax=Cetraspora pellucida TaxID=1433469 RepID=A0A9N9HS40_9GLOM|nr:2803_t:CDS:10 [Cetraspora pellucida]